MATIKTFDFISKIGDVYFVIFNTLNIIKDPDVRKVIVERMMQGSDQVLQRLVSKDVLVADSEFQIKLLKEELERYNFKKVEEYVPLLLNQNLVMLCTIMEIFFVHILETIIAVEPNTLIGLSPDKNITLQQVINLKDYSAIIEEFTCKVLDHFSRQGLDEKIKVYEKIGIDINQIFDYSSYTSDIQSQLSGYDLEKLSEIFDKRHAIVHKNELPLTDSKELGVIKEFFEKIILNLSTLIMDKYSILLDFQEKLVASGYPRDKIPVKQRKN